MRNRFPDVFVRSGLMTISASGVKADEREGLRVWTYKADGSKFSDGPCPECGAEHAWFHVDWRDEVGMVLVCPDPPTPAELLARAGEEER